MKRMLSLVMVLVLVLSLGTVAFADEVVEEETKWDGIYTATTSTTFNIKKTYNIENDVTVDETLTFTSTPDKENPDYATNDDGTVKDSVANLTVKSLGVGNMTASNGTASAGIEVTVPSYSQAGVYNYTIKETAGNTAGVSYSTDEVHVIVLVEYDNTNHNLVIANTSSYIKGVVSTGEDGEEVVTKKDDFTNTFKSGSFTVAKEVTGNMANENDEFEISVTLTSTQPIGTNVTLAGTTVTPDTWSEVKDDNDNVTGYTYTHTANYSKAGGAKTFTDIPVGVVVTVSEKNDADRNDGYNYVSTKVGNDDFTSLTVADDTNAAIVVTNNNSSEISTGISMDTLPYVLLLAVACVGIIALVSKKRLAREH